MFDLTSALSSLFFILGLIFVFFVVFPPLHLTFSPEREEKEKKLLNLKNFDNLSLKDKVKVLSIFVIGVIFITISCIISIY